MEHSTVRGNKPPLKRKAEAAHVRHKLTREEVELLVNAAKRVGRHGHRDATLIMCTFIHALRVSEVISLTWDKVDFEAREVNIIRTGRGEPSKQKIQRDELSALLELKRSHEQSEFVFCSERGGALNRRSVCAIVARAGKVARLPFPVHPYMIRHARGYELAAKGVSISAIQKFMGHRNIQHTLIYQSAAPSRAEFLFEAEQ